jgi:hypothetical protein
LLHGNFQLIFSKLNSRHRLKIVSNLMLLDERQHVGVLLEELSLRLASATVKLSAVGRTLLVDFAPSEHKIKVGAVATTAPVPEKEEPAHSGLWMCHHAGLEQGQRHLVLAKLNEAPA